MTGMGGGGGFVGVHACFLKRYLELCLKWRTLHMFTAISVYSGEHSGVYHALAVLPLKVTILIAGPLLY